MASRSLGLSKIVIPKSSDLFAAKLRDMILGGELAAGDMLPSERGLVEESGLSRGSVREALRKLEAEGLVETVRGRNGGTRVTAPQRADLARSVQIFVRANSVSITALMECRAAVEPMLARLAARYRSPQELELLEKLNDQFKSSKNNLPVYRSVNYSWHRQIAYCSRNEPLIVLIDAILTTAHEARGFERVATSDNKDIAIEAHDIIMQAIREQDEEAAAAAMEAHLRVYSKVTLS